MVRFLRWATFLVLLLVLIGAGLSYPILRDRFFGPMLAAPAESVEVLASLDATAQPTNTTMPTMRPTLAASIATQPAVIISAPSPVASASPSGTNTEISTGVVPKTSTPQAIATTSLLGVSNTASTITPQVLGPTPILMRAETTTQALGDTGTTTTVTSNVATLLDTPVPAATVLVTAHVEIAPPATALPPTPTEVAAAAVAAGEKGYVAPIATSATPMTLPATTVTEAIVTTPTPIVVAPFPVEITPTFAISVELTPASAGVSTEITPVLAITIALTPPATPLPTGPTARAASPLYSAPDFNSAVVGQTAIGETLTIVGMYTEGTWYLLANGMWIPGAVVDNAPLAVPLVSPTITPVPSSTPTVTPTPIPTATPLDSATPSPTATSLEQSVCDCSGDTLDCLGNIFTSRAEAQQCFEYCFRQTGLDIHLLDPNLNGVACENLP